MNCNNEIKTLPKVCVLMATYNGEKYLREQIDSILLQQGVQVLLVVRDDGSSDSTIQILSDYMSQKKLTYSSGKNVGPANGFMELLKKCPQADYYAFADQDDVWLPDKLITAVIKLNNTTNTPALYFCQTQLVDSNLKKIENVEIQPMLTFGESLVYHFIGGCTMVMNEELRYLVNTYLPPIISMHDIWIYKIALAVNSKIVFDSTPHILYRQHSTNTIGQKKSSPLIVWMNRLYRFMKVRDYTRSNDARELKNGYYGYMSDENRKILQKFLSGKSSLTKRLSIIYDNKYKTADNSTNISFQIAALLNSY